MAGRNVEFVTTIPGRYALSVNDAAMPTPKGWAWTLLTDVAQLESGHTPSRNHSEYWDGDIPWIGIKDARAHHGGVINDTLQIVTQAGIDNSAARILPSGTVCLSRTASVGYVVKMGRPMATSQDFVNWVCSPAIDPDYLKWIFLAEGEEGLRKFGKGTTHTTIYFPEVKAFHVCIAPLNEQRRIVAKLDAIFEQTRVAKARLKRLPALLEKLKRSILAAAFRGDLTTDWRAAHPNVEPASVLLDRIRVDRRRRWEADIRAKGKDPSKAKYEEPAALGAGDRLDLPSSWVSARWEHIGDSQNGRAFPSSEYCEEGIRLLRPGNLHVSGAVQWTDENTRMMPEQWAADFPDFVVGAGELLINLTAQSLKDEFLGRVCLTGVGERALLNQRIGRLTPTLMSPRFMLWLFKSPLVRGYIDELNSGSLIQHMFTSQIAKFVLPIPPLAEQTILVERIEGAMAQIAAMQKSVTELKKHHARLEQAALAKTFRGELVPQNPDDEPASVLLKRISAARTEPEWPRRTREPQLADAPTSAHSSNGHSTTVSHDDSLDLVIAALQGKPHLTAADIVDATNLSAPAVKQALKTLVTAGQVRIHGKARGISYEWIA